MDENRCVKKCQSLTVEGLEVEADPGEVFWLISAEQPGHEINRQIVKYSTDMHTPNRVL